MAKALAKPDIAGLSRVTRTHQPEASPPSGRLHAAQRLDDLRIETNARKRFAQAVQLRRLIGVGGEVLQSTTAASAKMPAWWTGSSLARGQHFDNPSLISAAAADGQRRVDMVAHRAERQINRITVPLCDAIAIDTDPLYTEFDKLLVFRGRRFICGRPDHRTVWGTGTSPMRIIASHQQSWQWNCGDGMYRWLYWSGITLFVVWTAFSVYSACNGL
jgi:hypothetical protein